MAIAFSASTDRSLWAPGASISTNVGIDVAGGNLVVITLKYRYSSTVTVQDDASPPNVFTVLNEYGSANYRYSRMAYCVISTAKTGAIFTASFGTSQTDRVTITVVKFTKSSTETWNADGGNYGIGSYGSSVSSGTFTTSYVDAVSIGTAFNGAGNTYPTTDIGNVAATVTPAVPADAGTRTFYRLHGAITNADCDVVFGTNTWPACQFYSFGVAAAGGTATPVFMHHYKMMAGNN